MIGERRYLLWLKANLGGFSFHEIWYTVRWYPIHCRNTTPIRMQWIHTKFILKPNTTKAHSSVTWIAYWYFVQSTTVVLLCRKHCRALRKNYDTNDTNEKKFRQMILHKLSVWSGFYLLIQPRNIMTWHVENYYLTSGYTDYNRCWFPFLFANHRNWNVSFRLNSHYWLCRKLSKTFGTVIDKIFNKNDIFCFTDAGPSF